MPREDTQFKKGQSGNQAGRPKGSISVIGALKKAFEENPEEFQEFLSRYKANPNNEKHITEMIDGKANQSIEMEVTLPKPMMDLTEGDDA